MYTSTEISKILKISRPTLYKLCKNKQIKPKRTVGGNYRYSEQDLKKILEENEIDTNDIETKFVNGINDIWFVLKKLAVDIWGNEGEKRLIELLERNKNNIFILNVSQFKET